MIVDGQMLASMSLAEIMKKREENYAERLEFARKFDQNVKQEDDEKLSKFNDKYPCLAKPFAELTAEEKKMMLQLYANHMANTMMFAGAKSAEVKQVIADHRDISKFDDAQLEDMYDYLVKFVRPRPSTYSAVQKANQEHEVVCFKISKEEAEDQAIIDLFEQRAKELLAQGKQVRIVVSSVMYKKSNDSQVDYLFSNETLRRLIALNNNLYQAGMKEYIYVNEYNEITDGNEIIDSWTLKDVVVANKEINNIVNRIKEQNLSPFETMMYIHKYITSTFAYQEGETEECRVIPGIFKNDKIVCSGYASLVKAIVDKLDIPELKCMIVGCELYSRSLTLELEGGHCHNLIYIKDEKYGIDGYYVEDACWDSKTAKHPNGRGFAHCMYPVGDLEHIKGMHYVQQEKGDRLSSLMFDPEDMEKALIEMTKVLKGEKTESALKQYLERRAMVKSGAAIVKKFAGKSQPITLEQYKKAIKTVLGKFEFCEADKLDETVEQVLVLSSAYSKAGFDKKAGTSFSTQNSTVKQADVKSSLSANDGRS